MGLVGLERFRTLFEQFRFGAFGGAPCNEEQRTGLDALDSSRIVLVQCRCGAVGSAPFHEEQRTGLVALERFRTLFEQVVAWCTAAIACCRAL